MKFMKNVSDGDVTIDSEATTIDSATNWANEFGQKTQGTANEWVEQFNDRLEDESKFEIGINLHEMLFKLS